MAGRIKKRKTLSYAKWGYLFILPFFIIYAIFQLYPMITTFVYAFQDVTKSGVSIVNKGWNNFQNFKFLFVESHNDWFKYFWQTMLMQFMGFVPQLIVSLVLAVWFTDSRLKLKGAGFFKAVIYMPNLIMATAMAQLFASMFQPSGPLGGLFYPTPDVLFVNAEQLWAQRWVVGLINFTMWFGNTTILLMAGVMGIDDSIFEAATIDGAGPIRTFKDITMPLLMPIFIYVFLTSLIGGIQMFDIPANLIPNSTTGGSEYQIMTIVMYLNRFLGSTKNYGVAGAISILLFALTAILSFAVYKTTTTDMSAAKAKKKAKQRAKKVNA
jgi:multiple sugar transport system permease protein